MLLIGFAAKNSNWYICSARQANLGQFLLEKDGTATKLRYTKLWQHILILLINKLVKLFWKHVDTFVCYVGTGTYAIVTRFLLLYIGNYLLLNMAL